MKANTKYFASAMRTYGLESLGSPVVYTRLNPSGQYPALGDLSTLKGSYVKGMFELGKYCYTLLPFSKGYLDPLSNPYLPDLGRAKQQYEPPIRIGEKHSKTRCLKCLGELDSLGVCRICRWPIRE